MLLCGIMLSIPSCLLGPSEEPLTIEEFKHFQEKEWSTELLPEERQRAALHSIECAKEQVRRRNWSVAEELLYGGESKCDTPDDPGESSLVRDKEHEIETVIDRQLKDALDKAE